MRHTREAGEPYSIHTAPFANRNDNYLPGTSGGLTGNSEKYSSHPQVPIYDPSRSQPQDESDLAVKNSIPRKQVGDITKGQASGVEPSFPRGPTTSKKVTYPLQSDPAVDYDDTQLEERKNISPAPGVLDRSRPITRGHGAANTAQRVVDRAQSNTVNTEVIETFAPGNSTLKVVLA